MRDKVIFFLGLVLYILSSCQAPDTPPRIDLPPTPSVAAHRQYAVIVLPQLRLRAEPSTASRIVTTFWNPSRVIFEVLSRSSEPDFVDNRSHYWYRVRFGGIEGWVFGAHIDILQSREEARVRIRQLRS